MSKVKPETNFEKYLYQKAIEAGYNKEDSTRIVLVYRTMIRVFKKLVKVFMTHFDGLKNRLCINIFEWFKLCTINGLTFRTRQEYMKYIYQKYYHRNKPSISEKKREILQSAYKSKTDSKIYNLILDLTKVEKKSVDVAKQEYAGYYFNVYKKQNTNK